MNRAAVGSVLFFLAAPGTVGVLAPYLINDGRGFGERPPALVTVIGGLMLLVALPVLIVSFTRFVRQGRGTPAPIAPTEKLVVTGPYRHVRNPMYVAVVSLIFGQAMIWGDLRVGTYGALVWMLFHLFVTLYEEPTLRRSFPKDYARFAEAVPRWVPRVSPWREV